MIDVDYYKVGCKSKSLDDIIKIFTDYCKKNPNLVFQIYESNGGVHGFLTSHSSDYKSKKSIDLMLDLDCDFYYTVYSYLRGWSIRLNCKTKDIDPNLYKYIKTIGTGKEDKHLIKLTNLHINLITVFANVGKIVNYI